MTFSLLLLLLLLRLPLPLSAPLLLMTLLAIGDAAGDAGKAQGLGPGSLRLRFSTSFRLARGRPAVTGSQHSKVDIGEDGGNRS